MGPSLPAAPREATPPRAASSGGWERLVLLGKGGMGEVWRVRDPALERDVALKALQPERAEEPENIARFLHEARVTAGLQHPGVIPVYALGETEDGRPCFTMPEVRGRTLKQRIVEAHDPGSQDPDRWTRSHLLDAFRRVCETLAYAHREGVVHRDVKPQNILIGDFGEVYVADWGLARRRQSEPLGPYGPMDRYAGSGVTMTGAVTGTPVYMSPEQARGDDDLVGPASDVYALGVLLYEILVGRPPFSGNTEQVLTAVMIGRRAAWPAGVPEDLRALADQCLSLMPEDRPEDAGVLAHELDRWLKGELARARALDVVAEGVSSLEEAAKLREQADRHRAEAAALLSGVAPNDPVDRKQPGWALEDEAARASETADLREQAALQKFHAALNLVPDLPEAHDRLADWYREAQRQAEARRDRAAAARAGVALEAHDRGQHAAWRKGDGLLTLQTDPPGAEALLYRYESRGRRLEPVFVRSLGRAPLRDHPLPMGSYRLLLRAPGRAEVVYPVHLGRCERWDGVPPGQRAPRAIWLPPQGWLGPDEVYVPAGWFQAGGDPQATTTIPLTRLWVDAFVLGRNLVTNGEYLAFLNDLVDRGHEAEALEAAPRERAGHRGDKGTQILQRDAEGHFVLGPDAEGDLWEPDHPVCLVGLRSAQSYAAWLAARTGRPWRLISEFEREKAARGVDARSFPWGDHFDATWARVFDSQPNDPRPASIHDFPGDESPYGARHLAGNLMSWCSDPWSDHNPFPDGHVRLRPTPTGEQDLVVLRGGGYWHSPSGSRCAMRYRSNAHSRSQGVGIRLAWSVEEGRGSA